jgi:hypothetical protein
MSYRSSIYIICATAYQWRDLTSVIFWAGISDLIPSGGWGVLWLGTVSHGWVDASCSGGFIADMTVALPCGSLYYFTGLSLAILSSINISKAANRN